MEPLAPTVFATLIPLGSAAGSDVSTGGGSTALIFVAVFMFGAEILATFIFERMAGCGSRFGAHLDFGLRLRFGTHFDFGRLDA